MLKRLYTVAMQRIMCKSKISGARVTLTQVQYDGSLGVDVSILDQAGIHPYEMALIIDVDNGNRFETYLIPEPAHTGSICVYGGAAKLTAVGHELIIISTALYSNDELSSFSKPTLVKLDINNKHT